MREYLHYSIERAVKTVAQTAASVIIASEVVGILELDWKTILSVSAMAGLLSLLTSVANYKSSE
jgi:hypothetical protein